MCAPNPAPAEIIMNQEPSPSSREVFATFVGWFLVVCQALALSVEVFLHRSRTFGLRYFGIQAGVAVLIIFVYTAFWPHHDARPLLGFLGAFLVMGMLARLGSSSRRRPGDVRHSFYSGYPRIMRFTGRCSELTVKRGFEPAIVFGIGVFTLSSSEPLGSYLMLAAVGLLVSVHMGAEYERRRALDMYDAYIEQRNLAERFRDLRGE